MKDSEHLRQIEERVRATICSTFTMSEGVTTERIEGRISQDDFDWLLELLNRIRDQERERCARLHEQINPASDDERYHDVPGAGAMGAVIEYRDTIRQPPQDLPQPVRTID